MARIKLKLNKEKENFVNVNRIISNDIGISPKSSNILS